MANQVIENITTIYRNRNVYSTNGVKILHQITQKLKRTVGDK